MKAAVYRRYGGPEVVELAELPDPVPAAGEVLIRLRAVTVGAADQAMRSGTPFVARLFAGLRAPKRQVLGAEFSGEVEAVGSGVTRFQVGDAVQGSTGEAMGAHAQLLCLPETGALTRKPEGMSHDQAAAIGDGALTALPFLRESGRLQAGQSVLINGASGAVGSAAVMIAVHAGAEVTGVCSSANVSLVRGLGAAQVIDYTQQDFTALPGRFDLVFDAVGKSSFPRCRGLLKPGGRYLTTVPSLGILGQMLWTALAGDRRAIFAATGLRKPAQKIADLEELGRLFTAGALTPLIEATFPLEQAREAHRLVDTGRKRGSVLLHP